MSDNSNRRHNYNSDYKNNTQMMKAKRYRDPDEGVHLNTADHSNRYSNHATNASSKKKDLIRKILENANATETRDNPYLKSCAENLRRNSVEEFRKFFQVLSNRQYLSSISDSFSKNKDAISINEKSINYNPNNLDDEFNGIEEIDRDISKVIVKKNIPLRSIIKEKTINSLSTVNHTKPNSSCQISFKSFFEDLLKTVKKENVVDCSSIQNMLKIYSNFVFNNGIISFNCEDKLLLDFIIENSLTGDNLSLFYSLTKYWLLQDFLNFEKDIEYTYSSEFTSESYQSKCRYDAVLIEVLSRIESHVELFNYELWIRFLEDLPRVNDKAIENLMATSDRLILAHRERIRAEAAEKKPLIDSIPHLRVMKGIYTRLRRVYHSSLADKLLGKFFDLTRSSDSHVIAQSIFFLKSHILSISKYEVEKTKEFALSQFKDLMKIKDTEPLVENLIISKYPLFFFLIGLDRDLVVQLPIIYANSHEMVRQFLNKDIGKILKNLDTFYAEKVINECTKECLPIVLFIIEGKLFKAETMVKSDRSLSDNKLLRRIRSYYNSTNCSEVLVSIADKIPMRDFFKAEENFVWEKIKQMDKMEESILSIFERLNSTKNEANYLICKSTFKDKLCYYIVYLICNPIGMRFESIQSDLHVLLKYYKLLKSAENISDPSLTLTENISGVLSELISTPGLDSLYVLRVLEFFIESFSTATVESEVKSSNSDTLDISTEIALVKLREYLNTSHSSEVGEGFLSELVKFLSVLNASGKEVLLKTLDERLKNQIRSKDFILFSDI